MKKEFLIVTIMMFARTKKKFEDGKVNGVNLHQVIYLYRFMQCLTKHFRKPMEC